jgi:hypothetical protein
MTWQRMSLLFRSFHQDTRLGASCKTGRVRRHRPDAGLKKSKECLRLLDAREVELENDVGCIIMGLMNAAGCYARLTFLPSEAVERCLPSREIVYLVLNVQRSH